MGKTVEVNEPYYLRNQLVRMTKGYTSDISADRLVYTADMFEFIGQYYNTHHTALKYRNGKKEDGKYGDATQYDCRFYLNQSKMYYQASKKEPFEVSMLSSYYCMLNLAKSFLSFKSNYVDDFVGDFARHGIKEDHDDPGADFSHIKIRYDKPLIFKNGNVLNKYGGVFPMLAKTLDNDFDTKWQEGDGKSLKTLLYNLPFVQSSFMNTYETIKNRIEELFIPLTIGTTPYYFQTTKTSLELHAEIDTGYLKAEGGVLSENVKATLSGDFIFDTDGQFKSKDSAPRNANNSISTDLKELNTKLRKHFVYIGGNHPAWFIKRVGLVKKLPDDVLNISTITINMAIMHRLSEIARYKPEQLHRLMNGTESWLLNEYMKAALDQFVDEMTSEITGKDVMIALW